MLFDQARPFGSTGIVLETPRSSGPVSDEAQEALIEAALRATRNPAWEVAFAAAPAPGPRREPILAGRTLPIDPRSATNWLRYLCAIAAGFGVADSAGLAGATRSDPHLVLGLLEAALNQARTSLDDAADRLGLSPSTVACLADVALLPILVTGSLHLLRFIDPTWLHGYCPICGAWPVAAEAPDDAIVPSRLRCGRCAAAWPAGSGCPFCGAGPTAWRRIAAAGHVYGCRACAGYLKVLPAGDGTLDRLLASDWTTRKLDSLATRHGYRRPDRPGFRLHVRMIPAPVGF